MHSFRSGVLVTGSMRCTKNVLPRYSLKWSCLGTIPFFNSNIIFVLILYIFFVYDFKFSARIHLNYNQELPESIRTRFFNI